MCYCGFILGAFKSYLDHSLQCNAFISFCFVFALKALVLPLVQQSQNIYFLYTLPVPKLYHAILRFS